MHSVMCARLAQSVEHETLNLRVVGSSPTLGETFFVLHSEILTDYRSTEAKNSQYPVFFMPNHVAPNGSLEKFMVQPRDI